MLSLITPPVTVAGHTVAITMGVYTFAFNMLFLVGEALLVAPTFDQTAQAIYLPAGSWLDLNSRRREAGGS